MVMIVPTYWQQQHCTDIASNDLMFRSRVETARAGRNSIDPKNQSHEVPNYSLNPAVERQDASVNESKS